MKFIVGLGNPGEKYKLTRHNIGYMVIDQIIDEIKNQKSPRTYAGQTKIKNIGSKKFLADIYILENKDKIILAKPMTYMNESGKVVGAIMNFYKITARDLVVISDDIDMELGKVRERSSGSSGGHKGLQSIIDKIGTDKFTRIKIGIGRSEKIPPDKWVLQKFSRDESLLIDAAIDKVIKGFTI